MKKQLQLLLTIAICVNNYAQETWKKKPDFIGSERWAASSFVIKDTAYLGLGANTSTDFLQDFYSFVPAKNEWKKLNDFPGDARYSAVSFTIGDYGYIGLGKGTDTLFNDLYKYNPNDDSWQRMADFPGDARFGAVSFVIDNKAYVGTGSYSNDFYVYDPSDNSWEQIANFSEECQWAVAFTINGKGYVCGGFVYNSGPFILSGIDEYDPATNSWKEVIFSDSYLQNKYEAAGYVANNKGYILAGNQNASRVIEFDPEDGNVAEYNTFGNNESKFYSPSAFVVDDSVYVVCGAINDGGEYGGSNVAVKEVWAMNTFIPVSAPTTQASIAITTESTDSLEVSLTNGNGNKRVVFASLSSTNPTPVNNTVYVASDTFSNGDLLNDWYCVFNDTSNSFTLKGLSPKTTYNLVVFEYNEDTKRGSIAYNTEISYINKTTSTTLSIPTEQATNLSMEESSNGIYNLSFTRGNGENFAVLLTDNIDAELPVLDADEYFPLSDDDFTQGTSIGDWYVFGRTDANPITIKGFKEEVTYKIMVSEYDGSWSKALYNLDTTQTDNPILFTKEKDIAETSIHDEALNEASIKIFPNPSGGSFNIMFNDAVSPAKYSITNILGKEIQSGNLINGINKIEVPENKAGIYFIQVDEMIYKIVKQ
jgi:hypothetical protein